MTETPAPYHIPGHLPPVVDPDVLELCELCFHRAIPAHEAAERLTALMQRRVMDALAGWVTVERGNGYEVLLQEDELYREKEKAE
jgi:hypothetical protein